MLRRCELDNEGVTSMTATANAATLSLGPYADVVEARLATWRAQGFAERLKAKDPALWSTEPVSELADRLGWIDLPNTMTAHLSDWHRLTEQVRADGIRHVVLLGMGGSSLAPEVFAAVAGGERNATGLTVLDTTHPDAVRTAEQQIELARSLFVVSSKSGTTLETVSLFKTFWDRVRRQGTSAGKHFVAITDPGTPLEALGRERGFRQVVTAPVDVGGRYSALSPFGLVPAALIGLDARALLDGAKPMAHDVRAALRLGAALGELAAAGRDKVTFLTSQMLNAFPAWLEQLIAESTGKDGRGIVPVANEPMTDAANYGADRFFVCLTLDGEPAPDCQSLRRAGHPFAHIAMGRGEHLGAEMMRWEVAVAAAGAILRIQPFNQPDVQLAKELARAAMRGGASPDADEVEAVNADSESLPDALGRWLRDPGPGEYVGIHAYLAPTRGTTTLLQQFRHCVLERTRLATTLGYGPRFLHSTGQLHKGGPNIGRFLQLVDDPAHDVPVPETDYTFGQLIRAQSVGDYRALQQRERRVLRVHLGSPVSRGLEQLLRALD